jgi:hypothetical protein
MLDRAETNKVLTKFSKYVVSQSRANLTRKDKNVKGNLYKSIKGETFTGKNSIGLYFEMEDYGAYQDSGVKGKSSGNSLSTFKQGGFRFGSGTGKEGGLTEGINQWVKDRRFQFKSKDEGSKGRFLSYEQTAFIITRSIYQKGIEATRFFSKPFEVGFERLPNELIEAYALDVEKLLQQTVNKK